MANEEKKELPLLAVDDILPLLADSPEVSEAIIVGGQALNIWAEFSYHLKPKGVMISEDVDFLASAKIASQISTAWGAEIQLAGWDDFTPNTAVVYLEFAGGKRSIDFLDTVLGIDSTDVRSWAIRVSVGEQKEKREISVMHPVHCMISQIFNGYDKKLNRRFDKKTGDWMAERARISVEVARLNLLECLDEGRIKDAKKLMQKIVVFSHKTPALLAYDYDGIDVLDAVPVDHSGWKKDFEKTVFKPLTKKLQKKRDTFSVKRKAKSSSEGT